MSTYAALAFQLTARSIERCPDRTAARAQMLVQIAEVDAALNPVKVFVEQFGGAPLRLVVLPEYLLTGFPGRISIPAFADKAALAVDGAEYDALGRIAADHNLFLAGNAYEVDDHFPGLYFQTSFVIAPPGAVVLRYRRLNSMFAPTPHDVWTAYLDRYGLDGIFPVARTEIGALAAIASEEIVYPEIARAHALRGAEVFVHSSSEIGSPLATHKAIARRARAFENLAWVVSANTAGIAGSALPLASADGNSAVVDWRGTVLAEFERGRDFHRLCRHRPRRLARRAAQAGDDQLSRPPADRAIRRRLCRRDPRPRRRACRRGADARSLPPGARRGHRPARPRRTDMTDDVPPPYSAVARHGMFPTPAHDEAARFDFLAGFNKYLSSGIGAGNRAAFDTRVRPAFAAEHGRDFADRHEIRRAMNRDPWHRFWSACKRNSMEMRQQNGRAMVLRQLDELDGRAAQYNAGRATLRLDPDVAVPRYQQAVDIHCMPGSYHGEERPGDVSAGANYDCGIFATTGGGLGALNDGGGAALVDWVRRERPGWSPRRILDLGATVGHNVVPLAQAFPDAEVVAIDTAAPVLRYGHARAASLGVTNLHFVQMNAEALAFPDGHFDWVQTTMYLHELSGDGAAAGHRRRRACPRARRADASPRTAAVRPRHAAVRAVHPRLGCVQQQ